MRQPELYTRILTNDAYMCSAGTQLLDSDSTRQRRMGSLENFNEDTDTHTVQLQAYILIHANHVLSQDLLLD